MPGVLPLIKLNDQLRLNLFNVTYVQTVPPGETDLRETANPCRVFFNDGQPPLDLHGDDATRFLKFWDDVGEAVPPLVPPPAPTEAQTAAAHDRDFSLGEDASG